MYEKTGRHRFFPFHAVPSPSRFLFFPFPFLPITGAALPRVGKHLAMAVLAAARQDLATRAPISAAP